VPVVIVLFVHGWKNNADYNNDNVKMFRNALRGLSAAEKDDSAVDKRTPRKFIGVFAGWRGLSASVEPFKELSFYERKNTAHRVGHAALTQLLVRLENLENASNKALKNARGKSPADDTPTELVIVGHSFGGAAVYSAVSQLLAERFIADRSDQRLRPLKPFGSLLILVNPAFEASRYYDLNELFTRVDKYPRGQRPVMAIFTSKADWATKYAFKAGRFLSTLIETYSSDEQGDADRTAVGHFERFITHDLVYDPAAQLEAPAPAVASTAGAVKQAEGTNPPVQRNAAMLHRSVKRVRDLREQWSPSAVKGLKAEPETPEKPATELTFDGCRLRPRPTYKRGDPFLVVSVDKQLIADHDSINGTIFLNFLGDFIQFSRKEARD
jgi:hypothetical protein